MGDESQSCLSLPIRDVDVLPSTAQTEEAFEERSDNLPTSGTPSPKSVAKVPVTPTERARSSLSEHVAGGASPSLLTSLCWPTTTPRRREPSCASSSPLIAVVGLQELPNKALSDPALNICIPKTESTSPEVGEKETHRVDVAKQSMVYNEYGELVDAESLVNPSTPSDLTVIQILRLIKKAYHHDFRKRMREIILLQMDYKCSFVVEDGSLIWSDQLSSWDFRPMLEPRSPTSVESTPEGSRSVAASYGPPRVLQIGCSDGNWCFKIKKEQPDWIVEGIDDTDHWSCVQKDIVPRENSSIYAKGRNNEDYFSSVPSSQTNPYFTVRKLNSLLTHEHPFPHNHYSLIRARDTLDRVESYKTFLDDIRTILQPEGVVEFLEIDPRPRVMAVEGGLKNAEDRKSGLQTDWTDNIADRFKDPFDEELATTVPGWSGRVAERLKAGLRQHDGVPATNLMSWMEGAGFWDVKEHIIRLPVGGSTRSGQLLRDFIFYCIELEDSIPKLLEDLPTPELDEISSGAYCLDFHIVTGRKPHHPRVGDLLLDGTRQEMTDSMYDRMAARKASVKSNQWQRFALDEKLTTMMENLMNLKRDRGERIFKGI